METLNIPVDPIENVERLMAVARESAEQLGKAVEIIRERDKQIDIAINALLELSMTGSRVAADALVAMKAEHDKSRG